MTKQTCPEPEEPAVTESGASTDSSAEMAAKAAVQPLAQGLAIAGGIAGYFIADAVVPSKGFIAAFLVGFLGAGGGVCALTVIAWLFGLRGSPADPVRARKLLWAMALFTLAAVAGLWLVARSEDAPTLHERAIALAKAGKNAEACELFEKAAEGEPMNPTVYLNWGLTLGRMGRHAWACEKLATAAKMDPQDAMVYRNWGLALGKIGRHAEAGEKFARSVAIEPENATAYCHWGLALALSGKRDEAEEKWRKAVELDSGLKPRVEVMRKNLVRTGPPPVQPPGGDR